MSKKILSILLVGILVLGVAAIAFAAPRQFAQRPILKDLNLSDEQYDKAREINEDFFEKMDSLRQQYAKKSLELNNLTLQKEPDEIAIQKAEDELLEIKEQMLKIRNEKINKTNNILTDEQLQKINDIREKNCINQGCRYRKCRVGCCKMKMRSGLRHGFCQRLGN